MLDAEGVEIAVEVLDAEGVEIAVEVLDMAETLRHSVTTVSHLVSHSSSQVRGQKRRY